MQPALTRLNGTRTVRRKLESLRLISEIDGEGALSTDGSRITFGRIDLPYPSYGGL